MKGVILAGGKGTRLQPASFVTNKILLPVYDKPMIYYPLEKLVAAGIQDIMIVTGRDFAGHFMNLLGSGEQLGVMLSYVVQEEHKGIAHALGLCKNFTATEKVVIINGDNIFEDDISPFVRAFEEQEEGARIFLTEHSEPHRFGVAEVRDDLIINIEEKPKVPKTNLVVTGLYMYHPDVFSIIKTLTPSGRGEYEITDVNNAYIKQGKMKYNIVRGFWSDAGTHDSLFRASEYMRSKKKII